MRILKYTPKQLVLQYRPFGPVLQGIIFVAIGVMFLWDITSETPLGPALALAGFIFGAGGLVLYFADLITCIAESSGQTVTIRRQGILRDRKRRYSMHQVRYIELYGRSYRGQINYKVRLLLTSGKALPLMNSTWWNKANTMQMAQTLSDFTHIPISQNIGGNAFFSLWSEWSEELR